MAQAKRDAPVERSRAGFTVASSGGRPVVTIGIIAICVVVWLGEKATSSVYENFAFWPLLMKSEPWRLITSGFLHSPTSVMHLAFNMFALYSVGQVIEPYLGRVRFAFLYVLSILGGSVGYMLMTSPPHHGAGDVYTSGWSTPVVGASGGIFGLFLALVILSRSMGLAVQPLLVNIAINAALPFLVPNVAWQAHVGGAIVGALVTVIILALRKRPMAVQLGVFSTIAIALVAVAYIRYDVANLGWLPIQG